MRRDLMTLALIHGAGRATSDEKDEGSMLELEQEPFMHKDGVAPVEMGGCIGVGGGRVGEIVIYDQGSTGNSHANASAQMGALMYAMGQLGPFGPPTDPPKRKSPTRPAPPSVPLCDRKKELRQIKHREARAKRLAKRLKSRKAQAFEFKGDATFTLDGESFPMRNVRIEMAELLDDRDRIQ